MKQQQQKIYQKMHLKYAPFFILFQSKKLEWFTLEYLYGIATGTNCGIQYSGQILSD